ncbi:c-type cytochrome [Methyloterricola oryzae]|uniref:c-type cytochrome n=1 Tax=Methyloterricola oryzae TaxID=1495050 RepID=UPI0005EBCCB1|nr:cytochrome c [Methyloterricola oryzae]
MKTKTLWSVAAGVGLLLGTQAALAAAPDTTEGQTKFYTCVGCHGIKGYSNAFPTYAVPKLGGQHADYVVAALKAYQSGGRKHGSMEGNSSGWSEDDFKAIAAYVAKFRSINEENPITGNPAAGKSKAETCGACHGEDGNSADASNPRLAGQYESYLIKALEDYKSGVRKNAIMNGMAAGLSAEDIKDISAYYASQKKGLTVVQD